MVALFVGGVLGSLLAAVVWGAGGWGAACAVGAALAASGLAVWLATQRVGREERRPAGWSMPSAR